MDNEKMKKEKRRDRGTLNFIIILLNDNEDWFSTEKWKWLSHGHGMVDHGERGEQGNAVARSCIKKQFVSGWTKETFKALVGPSQTVRLSQMEHFPFYLL